MSRACACMFSSFPWQLITQTSDNSLQNAKHRETSSPANKARREKRKLYENNRNELNDSRFQLNVFNHSFIQTSIRSLSIHLTISSSSNQLTHSVIYLFNHQFTHSLIHSFIYSTINSLTQSFIYSTINSLTQSFIYSTNNSLNQQFAQP